MTIHKLPTSKAQAFVQTPNAPEAKSLPPLSRRPQANQMPRSFADGGRREPSDAAVTQPHTPFTSRSRTYQPPEAAKGDDDVMSQQQAH